MQLICLVPLGAVCSFTWVRVSTLQAWHSWMVMTPQTSRKCSQEVTVSKTVSQLKKKQMPLLQKCLQQFNFLFTNRHVYYSRAQARKEYRHHCAKYQTAAAHKHWEESRTQQAEETLVHYKTPSCIEVALLKSVTRGPGLGCHMPGSAKPWTLR